VRAIDLTHGFDLDDDLALDDQVEPVAIDNDALVADDDGHLPLKRQTAFLQLDAETVRS